MSEITDWAVEEFARRGARAEVRNIFDICPVFGYYVAMTTAERINKTLQHLGAPFQQEVLDFVEFLLKKQSKDDEAWKEFSLSPALQGLENDEKPEYGEKMELMRTAMSDPLFLADLEDSARIFNMPILKRWSGEGRALECLAGKPRSRCWLGTRQKPAGFSP